MGIMAHSLLWVMQDLIGFKHPDGFSIRVLYGLVYGFSPES